MKTGGLKPGATAYKPGGKKRKQSFNPELSPSKDDVRKMQAYGLDTGKNLSKEEVMKMKQEAHPAPD